MKSYTKYLFSFILLSFFFLFNVEAQAQTKSHFRILENGVEVQNALCEQAVASLDMDKFRYIDTRRQIAVQGTNLVVELLSGNELWTIYQKIVSPNNILAAQDAYSHTAFILYPDGRFKPMIQ